MRNLHFGSERVAIWCDTKVWIDGGFHSITARHGEPPRGSRMMRSSDCAQMQWGGRRQRCWEPWRVTESDSANRCHSYYTGDMRDRAGVWLVTDR